MRELLEELYDCFVFSKREARESLKKKDYALFHFYEGCAYVEKRMFRKIKLMENEPMTVDEFMGVE